MFAEAPVTRNPSGPCAAQGLRPNPLVTKLTRFIPLEANAIEAIERFCHTPRAMRAQDILVHDGSRVSCVSLLITGFAYRYKYLPDGRRQILGYLLPGDLCDTHFVINNKSDHNIALLTDASVVMIPNPVLMSTMVEYPQIERALLLVAVAEWAMLREWLLNVGQRPAMQKLAHFFCEIAARLRSLGVNNPDSSYSLPLTQVELADTVGLTTVHVNRVMQRLRRNGIVAWSRGRLVILNQSALERIAGFEDRYLHLAPTMPAPAPDPVLGTGPSHIAFTNGDMPRHAPMEQSLA